MSDTIPIITLANIKDDNFIYNYLYKNLNATYYWSQDFSPDFYIELAKRGLISTSNFYEGYGDILLPEMQDSYAVLFFDRLYIEKKVRKELKNDNYSLRIGKDLDSILPMLSQYHKDLWLTDSYIQLLYELKQFNLKRDNFELQTTLLEYDGSYIAGEIGYVIGNVYTSLTGYCKRGHNNSGKIQMVLLAKYLDKEKFSFWNLGHPYMEYKIKLGAEVLNRNDFLKVWLKES